MADDMSNKLPKLSDWSLTEFDQKLSNLPSNTESIKSFLTLPSCLMGLFVGILSNGIVLGMIATFWIKSFLPPSIIITDEIPPGTILLFSGNFSKLNSSTHHWLLCDGSEVSRFIYSDLFDIIGETYGPGNGIDTFNLPDFRGRFPLGSNRTNESHLVAGGSATHVLTLDEMPTHSHNPGTLTLNTSGAHIHGINDPGHNHGGSTGSASYSAGSFSFNPFGGSGNDNGAHAHSIATDTTDITLQTAGAHTHVLQGNTSFEGGNQPIDKMPPYQTIHYIIRT